MLLRSTLKHVSPHWLPLVGVLLLAVVTASPATASVCPAPEIFGPIVNPHVQGTMIVWEPLITYETLTLRVSAPCGDITHTFKAGETPFFDVTEVTREMDGRYAYELEAKPKIDPAVAKQLEEVRGTPEEQFVILELWDKGLLPRGPFRQSGSFQVVKGLIADPGLVEKEARAQSVTPESGLSARFPGSNGGVAVAGSSSIRNISAADFVIIDDLIVDGSACIGFDCVNGESFGFDTIRVKENNLRIKFDDTSTAASFPRNDWQITANDSANGGQSKFSIDDISGSRTPFTIEANARSHSLYVDDGGRIGIRTSTPSTEIHVVDGDTPTLRLQQDGSSGFAPQTWDVAGNETSFFIRDVTNGSTLPFRIEPDTSSNVIYIDSSDNVGLGTTSPDFNLDIDNGTSAQANFVVRGTSGSMILQDQNATSGQQAAQNLVSNGTWRLRGLTDDLSSQTVRGITLDLNDGDVGILCDSNLNSDLTVGSQGSCSSGTRSELNAGDTMFTASSSRSIKENLKPTHVEDILDRIRNIDVYQYDFIQGPKNRLGLMAEDFHQVFQRGSDKVLSGQEVQMALWLAVKKLAERTDEVAALESENDELLTRQEQLEKEIEGLKELIGTFVKGQR